VDGGGSEERVGISKEEREGIAKEESEEHRSRAYAYPLLLQRRLFTVRV
jgi:hypothetical protein